MSNNFQVGVIGAGAWGTALSVLATRAGSSVTLWTRNPNIMASIRDRRSNDIYLPGVFIDPNVRVTESLSEACRSDIMVMAVPAQNFRSVCIAISDLLPPDVPVVICTKGIERGSLALMSEITGTILPKNPLAALSGPNFADEAAKGLPTAATIACARSDIGDKLLYALGGKLFRPYLTDDVIGTQIGGAVKNVIAIACGIAAGRGLGENARAAIVTRGFAEIVRLCLAKGGKYETLSGLSGLGDLILTCTSAKSRNMALGIAVGQGKPVDEVLAGQHRGVTEGVATAESTVKLAKKLNIPMPISEAVYGVLSEGMPVESAIQSLLERPFAAEGF